MGDKGYGGDHWSNPSNVLRDSLKTTMSYRVPEKQPEPESHVGFDTGSIKTNVGNTGLYKVVQGPNGSFGIKDNDQELSLDSQLNLGSVGYGHENENHKLEGRYNKGWGGGFTVHKGEMPGATVSFGPGQVTARSTLLSKLNGRGQD